jgi:DME family drug/metabolite transporter
MLPAVIAIIASFTTALSSVMATRGMKDSNPDTANLVLTGIQTIVLTGLLLANMPTLNMAALFWYAVAGVCGSFIARLFTMMSYKSIGVSAGSALIGTSPVVATILAVIFLGEPLLLSVVIGASVVVCGIALINMKEGRLSIDWRLVYLPLAASTLYALSNILRKLGTNLQPDAVLGAQVSTFAGLVTCVAYLAVKDGFKSLQVNRDSVWWLAGSGIVNAAAWITITMAINLGKVSVVTSIVYSYPLFSVLLSRLIIRDELINRLMVLGSMLIVLGVAIVSLFE